jgi:hypothetical protein
LIRLDTLRKSSLTALSAGYEAAVAALPTLQEYAAALKEAEEKGFPGMDKETGAHSDSYNHNPSVKHIQLTWNNETHNSLTWERANIVWNLITLEAFQAFQACPREPLQQPNQQQQEQPQQQQQPLDKHAWTAAGKHLERAAALAQYLRTDIIVTSSSSYSSRASASAVSAAGPSYTSSFNSFASIHLQPAFLQVWQGLLLATAQWAAYQTFACAPRPRHFMLAKLAAATAPLYQKTEEECQALLALLSSQRSLSHKP